MYLSIDFNFFFTHTFGHQFATTINHVTEQAVKIAVEQHKIIEQFAAQGSCIIVGRCADVILEKYSPFNIFVYANKEAKLQRCKEYATADEKLSSTELVRKMREIDKNRAAYRNFLTDTKWGEKENYNLCINTTGVEIKRIAPNIATYIDEWFKQSQT